ncbi:serpin family protein [Nocardioides sp. WS12]|uniref:serpin family protein n=1 Tax=Nocardioides sp. WS12 TaxID=2486272 RepID=UPI00191D5EF7|nr:serpin family protein [Nocardioides sp. WS12]
MSLLSIARRDTFRFGLLGLAALSGATALTACSGEPDVEPGVLGPGTDGIELVSSDVKRVSGDPTVLEDVVVGLQALAGDLYGGIAAKPGNLVFSPYSVLVALGMTLVGAAGKTADEMRDVLGVGDLGDRWHKGVNALTSYVDGLAGKQQRMDGSDAELALATANQLFGQKDVGWEAEFLDLIAKEYGAGLRAVDFKTASEEARVLINAWVEDQTRDRIVDLIPEGVLDDLTRLVLVNAIYLKAPWEQPFEKAATTKGKFTKDDGSTVDVDMMNKPDLSGGIVSAAGWRGVILPYAGSRLAMTVVLPDQGKFAAVEASVVQDGLGVLTPGGAPAAINLTLPKWTFRTEAPLGDLLKEIGMPTAFIDGQADFTPMTDEDLPLHIAAVLHQGFIAVDEDGTEAAAATAVVMRTESAVVAETFTVDRPFLFVIHDLDHNAPLFVGRVVDPSA